MAFDLAGLMEQASQAAGTNTKIQNQLLDITQQTKDTGAAAEVAARNGTDKVGNTVLSVQTELLGKLQAQENREAFRTALGENGPANAQRSVQLAAESDKQAQLILEQAKTVSDKKSVGLFDDPLTFLWNQVTLPDEQNKLNGMMQQQDVIQKQIQFNTQALDNKAIQESKYAKTLTQASIDSVTQATQANLDAQAFKARQEALNSNAHMLQNVASASKQQLDIYQQVLQAKNSEEHMQLARASAAREAKKFELWKEEQQDKKDFDAQILEYYNKGAEIAGRPKIDAANTKQLQFIRQIDPNQFNEFTQTGWINSNLGMNVLGTDPYQALKFSNAGRLEIPEHLQPLYEAGGRAVKLLRTTVGGKKLDPAEEAKAFNDAINAEFKKLQTIKDWDATSNPMLPPSPKTMANTAAVTSTNLWRSVLAPQVEQGFNTSDPNRIMELGIAAVKAGKLTLPELTAGFTTYYQQGMLLNNEQKQFAKHGFNDQLDVRSKMQTGGFGRKDISLIDSTEVNEIIVKRLATQMSGLRAGLGDKYAR